MRLGPWTYLQLEQRRGVDAYEQIYLLLRCPRLEEIQLISYGEVQHKMQSVSKINSKDNGISQHLSKNKSGLVKIVSSPTLKDSQC